MKLGQMVRPLLPELPDARIYIQDEPEWFQGADVRDDTALEASYHHDVETLPTLIRMVGGKEVARAEGFEHILVDTSGLVIGWPGRRLKQQKLDAVDPDLVLVLERGDECAPIVERFEGAARPRVVRLRAPGRLRSRSQTARRDHRARALDRYLREARLVSLAQSVVTLQLPRGLDRADCVGALCGLDDASGNTLALGTVQEVTEDTVRVLAPLPRAAVVARVRIGRERRDGTPLAPAPARRTSTPVGEGRGGAT